jgi:hypothetical protein
MKIAFFSFLMKNSDYGSMENTPAHENERKKRKGSSWGAYKCFLFFRGRPLLAIGPHCSLSYCQYHLGPLALVALALFSALAILMHEHFGVITNEGKFCFFLSFM